MDSVFVILGIYFFVSAFFSIFSIATKSFPDSKEFRVTIAAKLILAVILYKIGSL